MDRIGFILRKGEPKKIVQKRLENKKSVIKSDIKIFLDSPGPRSIGLTNIINVNYTQQRSMQERGWLGESAYDPAYESVYRPDDITVKIQRIADEDSMPVSSKITNMMMVQGSRRLNFKNGFVAQSTFNSDLRQETIIMKFERIEINLE